MFGIRWSKLCLNCSITALVGLTGEPLAALLARSDGRRVFFSVLAEVVRIAAAAGVRLEKLAIDPALFAFADGPGWLDAPQTQALQTELLARYSHGKPSIQQSLERGRPTEIDFINGYVVRTAQRHAIAAPLNTAIVELIHQIEARERTIGGHNLAQLTGYVCEGC